MILSKMTANVLHWIDMVAELVMAIIGRFRSVRRTQFIEEDGDVFSIHGQGADAKSEAILMSIRLLDDGALTDLKPKLAVMLRGSDVEVVLRPSHFLVRSLELPKRAGEFLDGIVRSQIDRLTPWKATEAVFGWTPPVEAPDERISLMVVATARARIEPYVQALSGLGASSIMVSMLPEVEIENAGPIRVFAQGSHSALGVFRVRHWLMVVLAGLAVATSLAATTAQFVGNDLQTQTHDVNRRISERRTALIKSRNATGGATTAQQALDRRKNENAASVIVLEALSQVLPDHTYVTELRVEGGKVQVIGVTRDAPSLVRLMEDAPHFTRATFFAPTTRSPGDSGERFHIEARLNSVFSASQ